MKLTAEELNNLSFLSRLNGVNDLRKLRWNGAARVENCIILLMQLGSPSPNDLMVMNFREKRI
jgi:hypothetical protein